MDQEWVPQSLRTTLREILECGNSLPFRRYYELVTDQAIRAAEAINADAIVELGAGTAPIARRLAARKLPDAIAIKVCDLNPDRTVYEELAARSHGRIEPIFSSVNFRKLPEWNQKCVLVLSATLHHIPKQEREPVLIDILRPGHCVVICEPLRNTFLCVLYTTLSIFPALLLPFVFGFRQGWLRRLLWCYAIPIAPLMFVWDGVVSSLRQWTECEWDEVLSRTGRPYRLNHDLVNQFVVIEGQK